MCKSNLNCNTYGQYFKALLEKHGILPGHGVEVMVTAGGNQAMINTALAILDPGDKCVLISPCNSFVTSSSLVIF
jgi:aspartate/methionine/tyrosine aminotransferase